MFLTKATSKKQEQEEDNPEFDNAVRSLNSYFLGFPENDQPILVARNDNSARFYFPQLSEVYRAFSVLKEIDKQGWKINDAQAFRKDEDNEREVQISKEEIERGIEEKLCDGENTRYNAFVYCLRQKWVDLSLDKGLRVDLEENESGPTDYRIKAQHVCGDIEVYIGERYRPVDEDKGEIIHKKSPKNLISLLSF